MVVMVAPAAYEVEAVAGVVAGAKAVEEVHHGHGVGL